MDPRCLLIVPTTACQAAQDMARMVVDLRRKVVTKAPWGINDRSATESELNAALLWQDSMEAESVERERLKAAKPRNPPPFALVAAVAAVAGDGLVADAITMLENALERKDDVDAAARLLLHHLHAAKRDLRQESDNHLQTDFDTGIPF